MTNQHMPIASLKYGQKVNSNYIISNIYCGVTKHGNDCVFAELRDATGRIRAVCWDPDGRLSEKNNGEFVSVTGTVGSYNGEMQICLEKAWQIEASSLGPDTISALVPKAPINVEEYAQYIIGLLASIQNCEINKICNYLLRFKYWNEFCSYPAGKTMHHAFVNGLLMHTVDMAKMADYIASLCPDTINRDLLIAGILLHDIGKIAEYHVSPVTGLFIGYNKNGRLLGHSVIGAIEVDCAAGIVEARSEIVLLLKHMILSHHGDPKCGAAKAPVTIEAEILHDIDLLDSRKAAYSEALAHTPAGEMSENVNALGRSIYRHDLAPVYGLEEE